MRIEEMQQGCDAFNHIYKEGDVVNVRKDDGEIVLDTIKYKASVLGGHSAMVWLLNLGCYRMDRIVGHSGPAEPKFESVTVNINREDIDFFKGLDFESGNNTVRDKTAYHDKMERLRDLGLLYNEYDHGGSDLYHLTEIGKQILGNP